MQVVAKPSPTSRSAALAAACSGCHTPTGDAIPSLDGWKLADLQSRLLEFKTQENGTTVMHRLMRGYDEIDIAEISAFLADDLTMEQAP